MPGLEWSPCTFLQSKRLSGEATQLLPAEPQGQAECSMYESIHYLCQQAHGTDHRHITKEPTEPTEVPVRLTVQQEESKFFTLPTAT